MVGAEGAECIRHDQLPHLLQLVDILDRVKTSEPDDVLVHVPLDVVYLLVDLVELVKLVVRTGRVVVLWLHVVGASHHDGVIAEERDLNGFPRHLVQGVGSVDGER